jgi:hypothetical protein
MAVSGCHNSSFNDTWELSPFGCFCAGSYYTYFVPEGTFVSIGKTFSDTMVFIRTGHTVYMNSNIPARNRHSLNISISALRANISSPQYHLLVYILSPSPLWITLCFLAPVSGPFLLSETPQGLFLVRCRFSTTLPSLLLFSTASQSLSQGRRSVWTRAVRVLPLLPTPQWQRLWPFIK